MVGGMEYSWEHKLKKATSFGCIRRKEYACTARLWLRAEGDRWLVSKVQGFHSCGLMPDNISVRAKFLHSEIRKEAISQRDKNVSVIIGEKTASLPKAVLKKLGRKESLKRKLRNARNQNIQAPKAPTDLNFEVPETLVTADLGGGGVERMLLFDSGPAEGPLSDRPKRLMIYTFKEGLDILARCSTIHADATFSSTPKPFRQTFVVSPRLESGRGSRAVPVAWALMTHRRECDYARIWAELKKAAGGAWKPKLLISDFERAIPSSFMQTFEVGGEETAIQACYFHFRQSIIRRRSKSVTDATVRLRPDIKTAIKLFVALAFVPEEKVVQLGNRLLFERKYGKRYYPDELSLFAQEFIQDYVGVEWEGENSSQPMFKPKFWNLFTSSRQGRPLTDNAAEGQNHALSRAMGAHPDLWKWSRKLVSVVGVSRTSIAEGSEAGPAVAKPLSLSLRRNSAASGGWEKAEPRPGNYCDFTGLWPSYADSDPIGYLFVGANKVIP
jgi:hypothetical protein